MPGIAPTMNEAECKECGAEFPLPVIAQCTCGSRQVRRIQHERIDVAANVARKALEGVDLAVQALRRHGATKPADMLREVYTVQLARLESLGL